MVVCDSNALTLEVVFKGFVKYWDWQASLRCLIYLLYTAYVKLALRQGM